MARSHSTNPIHISVSEFKATCLRLIERIRTTGESIIITKNGKAAAMLSQAPKLEVPQNIIGMFKDKIKITGDVISPQGTATWNVFSE